MEKYLRLYAEPEIAALDGLPGQVSWTNVMVIPACNESAGFLRSPPPCAGRSLMILVINEPESASHQLSLSNQALADAVFSRFQLLWQSHPGFSGSALSLLQDPCAARDVLLVDRFSEANKLPVKGGVGLARKIGVDLAASLIHRKRIQSTWIHCTDADVELPETYFTCSNGVENAGKYAALIYPFRHCDGSDEVKSKKVTLATQLYELSLRYYVAGMKFAGSPYAFHTIGSTMAVSAVHYAKVRGFPKREAGEDFYLLNKLAKVGSVLELGPGEDCLPIEIESRRSNRVPFGTGAAVNMITALNDPVEDFRFYDPAVFELLQIWLQSLPVIWQSRSNEVTTGYLSEQAGNDQNGDHGQCDQRLSLLAGLKHIKAERALGHAFRQSRNLQQFTRHIHTWFDAFRTLKLIHALRDSHLPSISYASLEVNQTFHQFLLQDPELLVFHEQLHRKLSKKYLSQ